jgi:RNA exonuclease NGL2
LSYNILADAYVTPLLYPFLNLKHADFNYRSKRVAKEIELSDSDIICLEEVDHYEQSYKQPFEKMGYECHITYRRGIDGILIGFKKDKFRCLKTSSIDHEELIQLYDNNQEFKRGNVGLIVLLEHL